MGSYKASLTDTSGAIAQDVISQPVAKLLPDDRRALGRGPTINILVGEIVVGENILKRALMALSTFFKNAIDAHPTTSALMLNPNEFAVETARELVSYITRVVQVRSPHAFSLPLGATFLDTVGRYRHVLMFGMEKQASYIFSWVLARINDTNKILSAEELDGVTQLPNENRLYEAAVRRFEGLQFAGLLPNLDAFKDWLVGHPQFHAAIKARSAHKQALRTQQREVQQASNYDNNFPALG